jgi:vancomycin aglycone glucosyltransferase
MLVAAPISKLDAPWRASTNAMSGGKKPKISPTPRVAQKTAPRLNQCEFCGRGAPDLLDFSGCIHSNQSVPFWEDCRPRAKSAKTPLRFLRPTSASEGDMKVLMSSIGSRGDVQPILALALEMRALGHTVVLCVAPNFKDWVESFGITCVPVGADLKKLANRSTPGKHRKPSVSQWQKLIPPVVREQFEVTANAASGCNLIVVGGALQTAGRSIAELLGIPYLYVGYAPAALPSPEHAPPEKHSQSLPRWMNRLLWKRYERKWNRIFLAAVNEQRGARRLAPVVDMSRYVLTARPWLAADAVLGPAPVTAAMQITQTGAWFLPDPAPLPDPLDRFLAAGEPPIYFGFGSMGRPAETSRQLVEGARALGRRAIISRGWANLDVIDAGGDCLSIGEVSHEKLLPRVAAVVHHGGAGTTAATARAGKPQVVIPHGYDQYYWAYRVQRLGVGVAGPIAARLSVDKLVGALRKCLEPGMAARSHALAGRIELRGARIAADRLIKEFG